MQIEVLNTSTTKKMCALFLQLFVFTNIFRPIGWYEKWPRQNLGQKSLQRGIRIIYYTYYTILYLLFNLKTFPNLPMDKIFLPLFRIFYQKKIRIISGMFYVHKNSWLSGIALKADNKEFRSEVVREWN